MLNVKRRTSRPQAVPVRYVYRGASHVELRRFDASRDSFVALTALLHRAFAPLGAQGLNCTCVDQTIGTTRERVLRGDCHVAVCEGQIVGTMTLYASDGESSCELYRHGDVASLRQFAVDPAWQARGIGTLLIAFAEHWAATRGYAQLALDTPQPAARQIAFYRGQGFRIVDFVRFAGKRYDSAILSKPPVAMRTLANWSRRLHATPPIARAA
ncbi:GNAT family N-acetyltransferase [Paraburkholderia sp. UYCP14C]|nr:GNAT family N-acetyltransferase [Paraburkholderia sp. UYCP14C]